VAACVTPLDFYSRCRCTCLSTQGPPHWQQWLPCTQQQHLQLHVPKISKGSKGFIEAMVAWLYHNTPNHSTHKPRRMRFPAEKAVAVQDNSKEGTGGTLRAGGTQADSIATDGMQCTQHYQSSIAWKCDGHC
jgi:hypothetical protein